MNSAKTVNDMTQYRKKPVVIEAVQFDGLNPTEIKDFVGENCEVEIYDNEVTPPVARIFIHTLEGDMEVSRGDYVIKGIKGEFYPCKPDIFEQTYESAETHPEKPEVDLEKEIVRFLSNSTKMNKGEWRGKYAISDIGFRAVANHFFELGQKDAANKFDEIEYNRQRAQGETQEHFVIGHTEESHGHPVIVCYPKSFEIGDNVIVQIRKK